MSANTRCDHGAGPAGTAKVTNGGRRGTSGAATLVPLRHAGAPQRDGCSNGTGAPDALAYVNPHSGMDRDPVSFSGEQCAGGGDGRRTPGRGSGPVGATDLGVQQPEPDPGDPAAAVVGVRALAPACRYLAPAVAVVPAGQRGLVAASRSGNDGGPAPGLRGSGLSLPGRCRLAGALCLRIPEGCAYVCAVRGAGAPGQLAWAAAPGRGEPAGRA